VSFPDHLVAYVKVRLLLNSALHLVVFNLIQQCLLVQLLRSKFQIGLSRCSLCIFKWIRVETSWVQLREFRWHGRREVDEIRPVLNWSQVLIYRVGLSFPLGFNWAPIIHGEAIIETSFDLNLVGRADGCKPVFFGSCRVSCLSHGDLLRPNLSILLLSLNFLLSSKGFKLFVVIKAFVKLHLLEFFFGTNCVM